MENKSFPRKREQQPSEDSFDFNEWCALARTDSEGFARRRLARIQVAIESAPERSRDRLNGLQFRIDAECRLARTPLKACLRLSSMMWDSFFDLNEALASLSGHTTPRDLQVVADRSPLGQSGVPSEKTGGDRPAARIIPFRRP